MVTVDHQETVAKAMALMKERKIRHLPVVKNGGVVVGVLSQREVLRMTPFLSSLNVVVSDVMIPDPYIVTPETPLVEIASVMAAEKYGCAVVVGARKEVLDIFTTTDALRLLSAFLTAEGKNRPIARYQQP